MGKKRHVLVDTVELLLHALVTSANVQDRDGGLMVFATLFATAPVFSRSCSPTAAVDAGPVFHHGPGARHARPDSNRNRPAVATGPRALVRPATTLDR